MGRRVTGRGALDAAARVDVAGAAPMDRRVVFISRLGRVCSQGNKKENIKSKFSEVCKLLDSDFTH
mgnify:CR=1 FL=1